MATLPAAVQGLDLNLPADRNSSFSDQVNIPLTVVQGMGTIIKNIDDKIFFVELNPGVSIGRFFEYDGGITNPYWTVVPLSPANKSSSQTALYEMFRDDMAVLPGWNTGKFYTEVTINQDTPKLYAWFGVAANQPLASPDGLNITTHYFEGQGYQLYIPRPLMGDASYGLGEYLRSQGVSNKISTNFE